MTVVVHEAQLLQFPISRSEQQHEPRRSAVTFSFTVDFKDIKSIVDLMKKNSLSEFEMEKEGFKIKLRRASREGKSEEVQVQHYLPPAAPVPGSAVQIPVAATAPATEPTEEEYVPEPADGEEYVPEDVPEAVAAPDLEQLLAAGARDPEVLAQALAALPADQRETFEAQLKAAGVM